MRSSREKLVATSASEDDSPGIATRSQPAWRSGNRRNRTQDGRSGSWGGRHDEAAAAGSGSALDEWDEAELAHLSPDSQKRERRRIANRACARRIRQRKTELLGDLTARVALLQGDNTRLLATLTDVTRCWRDSTIENCELRSQIALLQAEGSRTSGGSSGTGSDGGDLLGSPAGLGRQLLSPGWPLPMVL
ncbi:hypothetical protein D9Q98_005555 [Chlorella vulgaris]|uniref:BZIP domain-containing protein n=1 Tax=Chlorella vulgaris TaxID=3077 RepID=A0A9D4TMA3_CHLVU|nr:hypothetical protein D9Q98_005555 [Chlorella vulgaris]